jgi:hypothetical protein
VTSRAFIAMQVTSPVTFLSPFPISPVMLNPQLVGEEGAVQENCQVLALLVVATGALWTSWPLAILVLGSAGLGESVPQDAKTFTPATGSVPPAPVASEQVKLKVYFLPT